MQKISIQTHSREEIIDISSDVEKIVSSKGVKSGLCIVQIFHTTAGLTINENADPDVKSDILKGLKIFDKDSYDHSEGNSPVHIKASLMGSSLTVIIDNDQLQLGTWQGIMFCEFDGPRSRTVSVKIIKDAI